MYTTIRPLKSMPYAQAKVLICDDGSRILRSYVTNVIEIDSDGWLICTGTYSQTTRKHIGAFMRELAINGFDYYLAKEMFMTNQKINIYTGEIASL